MRKREIGAIPYLIDGKKIRFVLVTTRSGKRWIFPKGQPEKTMTSREVAQLEAYEEAGVVGRLKGACSKVKLERDGELVHYSFYPLRIKRVLQRWPEADERRRKIVSASKAMKLIEDKPLRKCIREMVTACAPG